MSKVENFPFYGRPILSLYNRDFYKYIFNNKKGKGLIYLLMLSILLSVAVSYRSYRPLDLASQTLKEKISYDNLFNQEFTFNQNINNFLQILHDFPLLQIEDNLLTSAPQKHIVTNNLDNKDIIIFNTSEEVTPNELKEAPPFFIAKNFFSTGIFSTRISINIEDLITQFKSRNVFDPASTNNFLKVISEFPLIKIENNKFISQENDVIIKDINDNAKVYINTEINDYQINDEAIFLAVTSNKIYFRNPINEGDKPIKYIHIDDINETNTIELLDTISKTIGFFVKSLIIISLPLLILTYFLASVASILIASFICKNRLLNSNKIETSIDDIMRVLAYSITPVFICYFFITNFLQIAIASYLIYIIIFGYYIYFALSSIYENKYA